MPPLPKRPPRTLDRLRPPGGTLGWGDSEMGGAGTAKADRYCDYALARLDQRPCFAGNYGIGSQTIANLAAVMQGNVFDHDPSRVINQAGTNDIGNGRSASQIVADMYELIIKPQTNHGIEAMLSDLPPKNDTSAARKEIARTNYGYGNLCAKHGLVHIRPWEGLRDPASGQWLAAYSADGVHANWTGAKLAAANVAAQLAAYAQPGGVYLADVGGTVLDFSPIPDPGFVGAKTNGLSTAWSSSLSGGAVTFDQVADETGIRNWQRFQVTSAPSSFSISCQIPNSGNANWTPGETISLRLRMKASGYNPADDTGRFYVRFDQTGGTPSTVYLYNALAADIDASTWYLPPFVTSLTTTALTVRVGWNSGLPLVWLSRPTFINHSREDVA